MVNSWLILILDMAMESKFGKMINIRDMMDIGKMIKEMVMAKWDLIKMKVMMDNG